MTQIVLGLGHKARHGKDSFARAVQDYYGAINYAVLKHSVGKPVIVQVTAFAKALRVEVNGFLASDTGKRWVAGEKRSPTFAHILELPDWVQPDPDPQVTPMDPLGKHPKLLQWWGTEFRRKQDQNYWVKRWKASINPAADIVLVTDMRFLNEAAAVREVGGYTVNVVRLNQDGKPFVDPSRPATHASETELDGYNYDFAIHSKDAVLTGEFAVTLVHFLRARASKGK